MVEVTLGLALVTVVFAMIAQSMDGLHKLGSDGETEAQLAASGNRALREVLGDLKRTGFFTEGASEYPHLFNDGNAGIEFPEHDHAPAETLVDYGVIGSREIVFRLPADADADGVPDLDGNGQVVWDGREFSYVLVTGPDGVNTLQRREDGAEPRTVARHVDRIIIDSPLTSFGLPPDALRVRLDMAMPGAGESLHTMSLQGIVRARNGS